MECSQTAVTACRLAWRSEKTASFMKDCAVTECVRNVLRISRHLGAGYMGQHREGAESLFRGFVTHGPGNLFRRVEARISSSLIPCGSNHPGAGVHSISSRGLA